MKVSIRVDSSVQIGTGHLMRCLTLAEWLRESGCQIFFICRELPGNFCNLIDERGYKLHRLTYGCTLHVNGKDAKKNENLYADWLGVGWETDAEQTVNILRTSQPVDWLVVDHYALDQRWERIMWPHTKKIMVIDDLADRRHDCDLLLDQNLYEDMESRYDSMVPDHCLKLLGPHYALLRSEFIEARKNLRIRDGNVKRILVFFGGADPTNETGKALEAIHSLNRPDIAVDVVVGMSNPHKDKIKSLCDSLPAVNYYCQVDNMAEMMARADLAIGAGGTTTWERSFLGLPAITVVVADNQAETTGAVAAAGAIWNLGRHSAVCIEDVIKAVKSALDNPGIVLQAGKKALALASGSSQESDNLLLRTLMEINNVRA